MPRRAGGKGGTGHKHHVKKDGAQSRYKLRLRRRGLDRSTMTVYTADKYPWPSRRAAA